MRKEEEHAGSRRRAGDGYGNSELDGALFSNGYGGGIFAPIHAPVDYLGHQILPYPASST